LVQSRREPISLGRDTHLPRCSLRQVCRSKPTLGESLRFRPPHTLDGRRMHQDIALGRPPLTLGGVALSGGVCEVAHGFVDSPIAQLG